MEVVGEARQKRERRCARRGSAHCAADPDWGALAHLQVALGGELPVCLRDHARETFSSLASPRVEGSRAPAGRRPRRMCSRSERSSCSCSASSLIRSSSTSSSGPCTGPL